MSAERKTCTKCWTEKPLAAFSKRGRCIECEREANRRRNQKYRKAHGKKVTERQREWSRKNQGDRHLTRDKEQMMTYRKKWEAENKEAALKMKIDYQKKAIKELRAAYIATTLRLPLAQVTEELCELKRKQLTYKRMARELRKELKNETSKDNT